MKNIHKLVVPMATVLITAQLSYGYKTLSTTSGGGTSGKNEQVSAGCAPPASSVTLDLNNVRTRIHTGGDMYWDLIGNARYEVPKGSGKHSIFAGSLWMGGVDVNNQLKVAAMRFRGNGYDYWPGPLDLLNAEIDGATCAEYDKFFTMTRTEVDMFVAWFECTQNPSTCDVNAEFPGYVVPRAITEWPAHGNVSVGQDYNLAPYFDRDGNGSYNPIDGGDYPYYERSSNPNCNVDREPRLYGDVTHWWVFNDKGNIHTESNGSPIGMEVRAQVFAFATNDEVNDMTFNNYELINRGSFTLTNTYFGTFIDPDLGFYQDDYVGCDVKRGLGYCYNGNAIDGTGGPQHYGANPPAVGVDFFQGPFQDADGVDNPLYSNCEVAQAISEGGIVYKGIGIGYGDGIVDNERFGMRKFLYFNNTGQGNPATQDPDNGPQYYNFLRGIWKDNNPMCFGANGHPSGGCTGVPTNYMFPGDSDPCAWGTAGLPQPLWTEQTAGNVPYDRRFVQSAGPFTLQPGAANLITYGVVWARATQASDPFASVEKLRVVDDKAQALFDNCFILIDGPDAPDVSIIELDRELVLTISNPTVSNNYNEKYAQADPFIIGEGLDNVYRFQGYQVFQLKDATVSSSNLGNPDLAREVAQVDIKDFHPVSGNAIGQLVNFTYSEELNGNIPTQMVNGANEGIRHSFRITQDAFATNDRRLVNHKKYYFMVIAYAYNNFKDYDPNDPLKLDGQKKPYLASRKNAFGGAIEAVLAIPHKNNPENGGTIVNANYGDTPQLTRVEGQGNGGRDLKLTYESTLKILQNAEGREQLITYENGRGPVDIKVVNPLKVPNAQFKFKMLDSITPGNLNDAYWSLECIGGDCPLINNSNIVYSERAIGLSNGNEQIIDKWGLSVFIEQAEDPKLSSSNGLINSEIDYSNTSFWLSGIPDVDGTSPFNWIRSGSVGADDQNPGGEDYGDPGQTWEGVLSGTWAPYRLASHQADKGSPTWDKFKSLNKIENLASVDVVFTWDKDLWTRCPVIELGGDGGVPTIGGAKRFNLRMSPSVGKDGKPDGTGVGMGWFPGYAINVETGERLNMAFGENSWLLSNNGGDMIWNPTSNLLDGNFDPDAPNPFVNILFGGMHYVYVFGHNGTNVNDDVPAYDEGRFIYEKLAMNNFNPTDPDKRKVWKDCMWVTLPYLTPGANLLSSIVTVRLRVTKPYKKDLAPYWSVIQPENDNLPMYTFSTGNLSPSLNDLATAKDALDMIRVVPNPYYAFSTYEANQLDNRVRIINLPQTCNVRIFDVGGTLIRQFKKDSPITSLDWDLKNHKNIPISSGVYLVHIEVPGVGEKVVKWFGAIRKLDLQSF